MALLLCLPAQPERSWAAEVGVVPTITWGQPREVVDRELELLRAAGVHWVRLNVNWAYLEPERGRIDQGLLRQYDYAVAKARAAGMRVLMLIGGNDVPYWASGDPGKHTDSQERRHWDRRHPPGRMSDYGRLVRFTVRHFRRYGVRHYEIWNEPNHPAFWSPEPDARRYVAMLRSAYRQAKRADRRARVILGGLSRNDYVYLDEVYRRGGRRFFDAVAVHPYVWDESPLSIWYGRDDWEPLRKGASDRISWNCFPGIREVRRTMVRHGDRRKRIWVTEFGWSVTAGADGVSEQTQARYLRQAFRYVERLPWVKAMFWYLARDDPFRPDGHWEAHTGLFTRDFRIRPAYHALAAEAERGRITLRVRQLGRRDGLVRLEAKVRTGDALRRSRLRLQLRRNGRWQTIRATKNQGRRWRARFTVSPGRRQALRIRVQALDAGWSLASSGRAVPLR